MVKVLLVYSNVMRDAWVPIGLLYIAANLRANGVDVKIADSKHDDVITIAKSWKPEYIGLGGMTIMAPHAIELGKELRKATKAKLIFGGVHFTFKPEDAHDVADYIVKGEGEYTTLDIVKGKALSGIPGIQYKWRGKWHDTGDFEQIQELDDLPLPAYDLIDMTRYNDELVTGEKAISILTGRGCPYNCAFCASPKLWQRKTRYHSIEYTLDHIKYLIKHYDLKNLRIMDDTFTANNKRVVEFCLEIIRQGIDLNMTCLTNVNNAKRIVFHLMKLAGFSIVAFGLESVDANVLRLAHKSNTEEKMRKAVALAHKEGLKTELLFMVGNPGDTPDTLKRSIAFAKSLKGYKTYFQLATPFPGSEFYDTAEHYGKVISRDWAKYNHKEVQYIPNGLDVETMLQSVKEGTHDAQC